MNNIIEYIESKYTPIAIIVYGSYCDGTNNENSDFDALVISDNHVKFHDLSFVDGVQLDLFIYPKEFFDKLDDFSDFIHIYYSDVVKDTNNYGKNLKRNIIKYVDSLPNKTDVELLEGIAWCQKMLKRSKQNDIEGMFRWHWLLTESLSIFCQLKHKQYFGSKKTLKWMKNEFPKAYCKYEKALYHYEIKYLDEWINYLSSLVA